MNHDFAQEALEVFFEDNWITDVSNVIKNGKEASVFLCNAHPSTGREFIAAKIYRAREMRNFKDDSVYRTGRALAGCKPVDRRLARAAAKKSSKGREALFASWVEWEFNTMRLLHAAGADIPEPFKASDQAILMEYCGEDEAAAPQLKSVTLSREEAVPAFDSLCRNIELWLACERIHGDLSPYNILYWRGKIMVIDFPQAVDPRFNRDAYSLLRRDFENVCTYFSRSIDGINPTRLANRVWQRYLRGQL